jgi:hypothetical protein
MPDFGIFHIVRLRLGTHSHNPSYQFEISLLFYAAAIIYIYL